MFCGVSMCVWKADYVGGMQALYCCRIWATVCFVDCAGLAVVCFVVLEVLGGFVAAHVQCDPEKRWLLLLNFRAVVVANCGVGVPKCAGRKRVR